MGSNMEFVVLVFLHPQVINLKSFNIDSMKWMAESFWRDSDKWTNASMVTLCYAVWLWSFVGFLPLPLKWNNKPQGSTTHGGHKLLYKIRLVDRTLILNTMVVLIYAVYPERVFQYLYISLSHGTFLFYFLSKPPLVFDFSMPYMKRLCESVFPSSVPRLFF